MSDETASFGVQLDDGVSKESKAVAKSLRGMGDAAKDAAKDVAKASRELDKNARAAAKAERQAARLAKVESKKREKGLALFGVSSKKQDSGFLAGQAKLSWSSMMSGNAATAQKSAGAAAAKQARVERKRLLEEKRQKAERKRMRDEQSGQRGQDMARFGAPIALGAAAAAVGVGFLTAATAKATLGAVKYRDEALTGLKLITGSAREANAVYSRSIKLSDELGQDWQTTVGGMQKLLSKGFDESFATDLTKGLADLSIVSPDANINNLILAIGQIKTAGKLQGDELNQLTEAGLNSNLMFGQLEKRLGKNRQELLKLKEAGKLLADDVLPSILDSIQEMTGKDLGQAAKEATKTTAGALRRLEQLPSRFFLSVAESIDKAGLDSSLNQLLDSFAPGSTGFDAGVEAVVDTMGFLVDTIDAGIPLAKEFGGAFSETLASLMGIESGKDGFLAFLRDPATLEAARELGRDVAFIADSIARIIGMASTGMGWIDSVDQAVDNTGGGVLQGLHALEGPAGLAGVAFDMAQGFIGKLNASQPEAFAAGASLGQAAIDGASSRQGVDAHSPSKKAAEVGGWTAKGLSRSLNEGVPDARRSGAELGQASIRGIEGTASRLPAVASGSAMGGSRSSNQMGDVYLQISGASAAALESPAELARLVRRELEQSFDALASQGPKV